MLDWLEQAFGALLVLLVLLDVFLTVLYARIGAILISGTVARVTWRLFRWLSKPLGQNRAVALSCCGPAILVLLVAIWAFGLTCGTALIIHPKLGTSVRVSSGDTPTDFVTAMYAGGSSVAIVGASDFTPHTSAFRMLFLFNSLVGMSVLSLTLTYLMQVYTALQRRNALGLKVHLLAVKGVHRDAPSSTTAIEAARIRCRAGTCDASVAPCFEKVHKHLYLCQS